MSESEELALTDEELQLARDAGASPEFMAVLTTAPGVAGVESNKIRDALKKHVRYRDKDTPDELAAQSNRAGGFYEALWDGDLYDAFCRADITNKRLMAQHWTPEYLIERGVAEDEATFDYATRVVNDSWNTHIN